MLNKTREKNGLYIQSSSKILVITCFEKLDTKPETKFDNEI